MLDASYVIYDCEENCWYEAVQDDKEGAYDLLVYSRNTWFDLRRLHFTVKREISIWTFLEQYILWHIQDEESFDRFILWRMMMAEEGEYEVLEDYIAANADWLGITIDGKILMNRNI